MGVILNRPSPVSVADAVPPLAELVDEWELVHVGGPVQPQAIVVLGDFGDTAEAAAVVLGSIGFLPGEIETAADIDSLTRARVFAGYAGWGPNQLEEEIAEEVVDPGTGARRGRLHGRARSPVERRPPPQGRRVRRSRLDATQSEQQLTA